MNSTLIFRNFFLLLCLAGLIKPNLVTAAAAPPKILSFSPTQGSLGTVVTINGTNFAGATSVTIGGVKAAPFTVVNTTTIKASVGAQSKTDLVTVNTPGGSATTAGSSLGNMDNGKFESLCDPTIDERRSLAINDSRVLNDSTRTGTNGHWNFNFLMGQMAPSGMTASVFIKRWLLNWKKTTVVNGFSHGDVAIRDTRGIGNLLSDWKRTNGKNEFDNTPPLDLSDTQFKLVAITFRPDLTGNCSNCAGEGRFVWQVVHAGQDEVILEYQLPISVGTSATTKAQWNLLMHDLSTVPFGAAYNARLQAVTDRFAMKTFLGVSGLVNGSGINQVRTNAISLEGDWSLREFRLTSEPIKPAKGVVAAGVGELVSTTTRATPAIGFDVPLSGTEKWVTDNAAGVVNGSLVLPKSQWGAEPRPSPDGFLAAPFPPLPV